MSEVRSMLLARGRPPVRIRNLLIRAAHRLPPRTNAMPVILDEIDTLDKAYETGELAASSKQPLFAPDDALNKRISLFRGDVSSCYPLIRFWLTMHATRSRSSKSTRSSTPRTGPCSAAAASTALYTARRAASSSRNAERLTDALLGRRKSPRATSCRTCSLVCAPRAHALLSSKHVIHAVGPIYDDDEEERCEKQLKGCYDTSLALAVEHKLASIAFSGCAEGPFESAYSDEHGQDKYRHIRLPSRRRDPRRPPHDTRLSHVRARRIGPSTVLETRQCFI